MTEVFHKLTPENKARLLAEARLAGERERESVPGGSAAAAHARQRSMREEKRNFH